MRSSILLLVLATSIISKVNSEQEWRVELLDPAGFRFFLKFTPGIKAATIAGGIYEKPYGDEPKAEYDGIFNTTSSDWWFYQNETTPLNPGDKMIFAIVNILDNLASPELDDAILDEYLVPYDATRVPV